jgi:hypothetical protein
MLPEDIVLGMGRRGRSPARVASRSLLWLLLVVGVLIAACAFLLMV